MTQGERDKGMEWLVDEVTKKNQQGAKKHRSLVCLAVREAAFRAELYLVTPEPYPAISPRHEAKPCGVAASSDSPRATGRASLLLCLGALLLRSWGPDLACQHIPDSLQSHLTGPDDNSQQDLCIGCQLTHSLEPALQARATIPRSEAENSLPTLSNFKSFFIFWESTE